VLSRLWDNAKLAIESPHRQTRDASADDGDGFYNVWELLTFQYSKQVLLNKRRSSSSALPQKNTPA